VLAALWLASFRVVIGPEQVAFSRPLRRTLRVARHDILSVEFAQRTGRAEGPMTLCIRLSMGEELRLNAKLFSREALAQLMDLGRRPDKSATAFTRY
jgi:hypothetical protein